MVCLDLVRGYYQVYIFQNFEAGASGQTRQNQPGAVQAPQQQPQQAMNIMPVSQPSMMTGQQSFPGQPGIRAQAINQVNLFYMKIYRISYTGYSFQQKLLY